MLGPVPIAEVREGIETQQQTLVELFYSYGALRKRPPTEIINVGSAVNPKKIPRKEYQRLQANCLAFNQDIATLYNRFEDLEGFFREFSHGDPLVDVLFRIYDRSKQLGRDVRKPVGLVVRNDMMYDQKFKEFKQVEFNNMSVGLGQLTTKLGDLTKHFYDTFLHKPLNWIKNRNCDKQLELFLTLHRLYGNPKAVWVSVMLENEPNIFDSIPNERALTLAGIEVLRLTLPQITKDAFHVDPQTKKLFVLGREAAVVYLRSLYDPSHFTDDRVEFWAAAEASRALLLPDIKLFLLGIKLTQHLFTADVLLDKYGLQALKTSQFSPHYCETLHISTNFANDRQKIVEFAKGRKDSLLIKALEEGGGGLILGDDKMIEFLETAPLEEIQKVLLAHRIDAPLSECVVLFQQELRYVTETTSELSIYTSLILEPHDDGYRPALSDVWDYLLRSKSRTEIKGGMNIGASYMDTLVYADDNN